MWGGLYARHQEVHGLVMSRLLVLLLATSLSLATAAEKTSVVGKVQPEIRLADGTVFKKAKIVDYSVEKSTATIAEPTRIRTVPLDQLPASLRNQLLAEAGVKPVSPSPHPEQRPRRPRGAITPPSPPPPDKTILPEAPATSASPAAPATPLDQLIQQASAAAPDEVKFHLAKTYDRVGSLTCKIREAAQVPGWQKIRVSGEAAFTQWDARQADHVWRTDKFEVEFTIVEGRQLKPTQVSFGGITRAVGEK